MNLLVLLFCCLIVRGGRKCGNRQTDRRTEWQTKYYNRRCACALRGKWMVRWSHDVLLSEICNESHYRRQFIRGLKVRRSVDYNWVSSKTDLPWVRTTEGLAGTVSKGSHSTRAIPRQCGATHPWESGVINPRHACAARVTVVVP